MSVAVLERSNSEVVVNVIMDLALNWQLFKFSDVGRPLSFVNMMSTNRTIALSATS